MKSNQVIVNFERSFTKGNLTGLTHQDKITFVSLERANAWLKGIAANASKLDYVISNHSIGGGK